MFDDLEVGQEIKHWPRKTITESDNNLFCLLTRNAHPLHSDIRYANTSQHRKIVVVGTYVFSLVIGMSVPDISGRAIANLEYNGIEHLEPVFIGDTIRAESEVIAKVESKSKKDRGIITIRTTAFNQFDKKVLILQRKILLPKRNIQLEDEVWFDGRV